jgi:H+/Cl- antiporter ClcA
MLSLGGGATLGPEQALGNLGGGLGYFLHEHIDLEDEDYDKIIVLAGMASALGALFPSPMLGALMMHELGEPPKSFMESTIILSFTACVGFAIYYEMIGVTYLEPISSKSIELAVKWIEDPGYQNWQVLTGFAIGCMSAILCTIVMINIGICKQIFLRLRLRLAWNPFLKEVIPPTVGGLIIGAVNWALPLTVGNGNMIFSYLIKNGGNGELSNRLLVCSGFARMFLLGISMNCGFVGGIIFPFMTMGMIAGTIMFNYYPYVPQGLCFGAFMVALPCGVVPMPFTFTALSVFVFYFGLYQVAPIFIATITAYLLVSGSGLFKKLILQAQKNNQAQQGQDGGSIEDIEKDHATAQKEADEYALKQYLGNKRGGGGVSGQLPTVATGGH